MRQCNIYFPFIWNSCAPSNVIIFSSQLLLGTSSSRENFFKINVNVDPSHNYCPLCGDLVESTFYLSITYKIVSSVWYIIILIWLGWKIVLHMEPSLLFESFFSLEGKVKSMDSFSMI